MCSPVLEGQQSMTNMNNFSSPGLHPAGRGGGGGGGTEEEKS